MTNETLLNDSQSLQIHPSKRRFFRLDVNLPFSCFKGEKKINGTITNLSAGGLGGVIHYDQNIDPGSSLACQFDLPQAAKPILLVGKVIRVQKTDDRQEIALDFQMLDKNNEALITSFLFRNQRKQINENRRNAPVNSSVPVSSRIKSLAG